MSQDPRSAPPALVTVILCDDVPAFRQLMRAVFEEHGGICVIAEAGDGAEVVPLAADLRPDIVLLDLAMPISDGLMATPLILEASPGTRVIGLSGFADHGVGEQMRAAGASEYLEKGTDLDVIAATVLRVAAGD